ARATEPLVVLGGSDLPLVTPVRFSATMAPLHWGVAVYSAAAGGSMAARAKTHVNMATWPCWSGRCIKRANCQEDSEASRKNSATFSKNAIGCQVFGRHPMLANGGQNAPTPGPQKRGKLATQFFFT